MSSSTIRRTKRIVKRIYKITVGPEKYKYTRLHFSLEIEKIPNFYTPLVCFINSKSGGKQGIYIKTELQRTLNPNQVIDLYDIEPTVALREFFRLKQFKVLVCGGDGTVGWVLDAIDQLTTENPDLTRPEVAVLPLGTGNDLAIELGWGAAYEGQPMRNLMTKIDTAQTCFIDRWVVSKDTQNTHKKIENPKSKKNGKNVTPTDETDFKPVPIKKFQNYFGVGVDAQIVLQFHLFRQNSPWVFMNRWVNKLFYGYMGWNEIWKPIYHKFFEGNKSFKEKIRLFVDNVEILLPDDTEGIVFTNISYYGGGSKLWVEEPYQNQFYFPENHIKETKNLENSYPFSINDSKKTLINPICLSDSSIQNSFNNNSENSFENEMKWHPLLIDDGLIEVVAVKSSFQLARMKLGLANCLKIAQGRSFKLELRNSVPLQTDGEPWLQSPCTLFINNTLDKTIKTCKLDKNNVEKRDENGLNEKNEDFNTNNKLTKDEIYLDKKEQNELSEKYGGFEEKSRDLGKVRLLRPVTASVDPVLLEVLNWAQENADISTDQRDKIWNQYLLKTHQRNRHFSM